jgi:hypothetical protein
MFLIFHLMSGFLIPPAANHPDDEPRSCSRSSRLPVSEGAFELETTIWRSASP